MKKLTSILLVLALCLCAFAVAEAGDDLQAQLDAANARIAELEALVELYKPAYEANVVATYGEDGVIWKDDLQEQFEQYSAMYSSYGITLDEASSADLKQNIVESLVEEAVLNMKADELQLAQLSEEEDAALRAEAESTFNNYVESYKSYFATEDGTDEDAVAATVDYLNQNGLTVDSLYDSMLSTQKMDALYAYATADVAITEEDIQATYDTMVKEAEEAYSVDTSYNEDRNSGAALLYNPEGYRAVKQVLVQFSDEQSARYNELDGTLTDLNNELDTILNPEEEEAVEEETSEEETSEEEAAPRTEEEIRADIANVGAEIEALYSELMPTAQEVIDAFNNGTEFDALIEQYNSDPGMTVEPTATIGYAVKADSTTWDPAFTAAAMSIESVGGISEPARGSYGIYILYYLNDIPAGPVALEEVRETVEAQALENKNAEAYNTVVDQWLTESNVAYYAERY